MKVLIIGQGGREHALAWKCTQSPRVTHVWVAPGNAGTALEPSMTNLDISPTDITQLTHFAQQHAIDLTIIGPEAPLAAGIVDAFQSHGLACFGPTQAACQLESSKQFCKDFLQKNNIPTAQYACFTQVEPALAYLENHPLPVVIKADGLAAGKGVVIAETLETAQRTIRDMLTNHCFGNAGSRIVIEEFLTGEELSFIVIANGSHATPLASSQDHKRRDNHDLGPNTGGMGAYSPSPLLTSELQDTIMETIIQPTLHGMSSLGHPYTGFLYAGLMITSSGKPIVLEFNCRLGDPETQPILMRLQSDFPTLCQDILMGKKPSKPVKWDRRSALTVVMAADGYPHNPRKGDIIDSLPKDSLNTKVFHAGTKYTNQQITTQGGRVLGITALGDSLTLACQQAYSTTQKIQWPGCFYRTDIGHRALAHITKK
ncbi:MAG TPA: phosphoribosylamine--glycine ligase [Coxiellaceae bacterium]|nr:phosphoribosylamine--glycine ligase [Coxiellaceae bacterium]